MGGVEGFGLTRFSNDWDLVPIVMEERGWSTVGVFLLLVLVL